MRHSPDRCERAIARTEEFHTQQGQKLGSPDGGRKGVLAVLWFAGWLAGCGTSSETPNGPLGQGGSSTGGASVGGSVSGGSAGSSTTGGTIGTGGAGGTAGAGATAGGAVAGAAGLAGTSGGGDAGSGGVGGASGAAGSGIAGGTAGGGGMGGGGGAIGGAAGSGGVGGSAGSGLPADPVWTPNVRLNDDTGNGRQSEVAMASGPNGLVMAGWMDERSQRVCAFTVSQNNGDTWSTNVSIGITMGGFVGDPAVGIDGNGTLYAGCQDYGQSQVKLMTSTNRGMTWSTPRLVQAAPDKPWLAGGTTDGVVFLSWLGNPGGIKRSTDHGLTWGPVQSTGNIIHGTAIVTSTTGVLHVPYNLDSNRNQLRYLRSRDNGATYEPTRDLVANMGTFGFSAMPRQHPIVGAAADPTGRIVAMTWSSVMPGGESQEDVWLLYSADSGDTWTQPIRVNDNTQNSRQFQPWVAVDRHGRVHVAWTDLRTDGMNKTYYARSADPRQGFERSMEVTNGRGTAQTDFLGDYKSIVVSGADVLIVWHDTRRDIGDIYFSKAPGAAGP
jgi:hypothetical protein